MNIETRRIGLVMRMNVQQMLLVTGLAFLLSGQAASQEVKIVVPNDLESIDGNSSSGGFDRAYRSQTLFPATQFSDLPAGKNLISQIAFRPDASVQSPITSTASSFQLRLSTTTADSLSTTYDDNVGSDELLVYSGDINWSTVGGPVGVKDFDYIINLQTPFFYDPSQGNLLVDEFAPLGFDSPPVVDQTTGAVLLRVGTFEGDVTGEEAADEQHSSNIPVRQFTFVPEPSTFVLSILGMLLLFRYSKHR